MAVLLLVLILGVPFACFLLSRRQGDHKEETRFSGTIGRTHTRVPAGWDQYDRAMDEAYKEHYLALKKSLTELRSPGRQSVELTKFRLRCAKTGTQLLGGDRDPGAARRCEAVEANPGIVIPAGCPVSVNGPGWAYCHVLYITTGRRASPAKAQAHIEREQLYTDAAVEKAEAARG